MSGDSALLELFRAEAEAHMKTLSDGLLELEQDAGRAQWYEPLMRAAHSIKGAAKIVGLDAAVPLAHAIEDYFVAARDGRTRITPPAVDVLLAGLDALQQLTQLDAEPDRELGQASAARISQLATGGATPAAARAPRPERAAAAEPAVFVVPETLDASWAEPHTDRVRAAFDAALPAVQLDFAGCRSIEPAGLAWLVRAARTAQQTSPGIALEITGAAAPLAQLLMATGLAGAWRLGETRS
jgi:chemotaxis protein histidine kinase CheA